MTTEPLHFKAAIQSTPSTPRAQRLVDIYNTIPGSSGPYCNPHSLAAVVKSIVDEWIAGDEPGLSQLIIELRGENHGH
jgi:hypothetical protein